MSHNFPQDIYTEPADLDFNTLNNLGPLAPMAGVWLGERGMDVKPKADGPREQSYIERLEMQPLDPQTNGPQLFYGLRYHLFINKPNNVKMYHDQVGYWLWEPATKTVIQTLAIPRGLIAMASATVEPDARCFELVAKAGESNYGICSNPFLEHAFETVEYRIAVNIQDDQCWSYDEFSLLRIRGVKDLFNHSDTNILHKIADPTPNPMALALNKSS